MRIWRKSVRFSQRVWTIAFAFLQRIPSQSWAEAGLVFHNCRACVTPYYTNGEIGQGRATFDVVLWQKPLWGIRLLSSKKGFTAFQILLANRLNHRLFGYYGRRSTSLTRQKDTTSRNIPHPVVKLIPSSRARRHPLWLDITPGGENCKKTSTTRDFVFEDSVYHDFRSYTQLLDGRSAHILQKLVRSLDVLNQTAYLTSWSFLQSLL